MKQSHWSKEELVAYILLYTAHSNFEEANTEKNVIISKVDMQTFQRVHDEFDNDNDYQFSRRRFGTEKGRKRPNSPG